MSRWKSKGVWGRCAAPADDMRRGKRSYSHQLITSCAVQPPLKKKKTSENEAGDEDAARSDLNDVNLPKRCQ